MRRRHQTIKPESTTLRKQLLELIDQEVRQTEQSPDMQVVADILNVSLLKARYHLRWLEARRYVYRAANAYGSTHGKNRPFRLTEAGKQWKGE